MRNSSADRQLVIMAEPTFQAHELVYCAKCFLPYDQNVNITEVAIPQDSQARSWYLTNCGHTLCCKCLFPNESTYLSRTPLVLPFVRLRASNLFPLNCDSPYNRTRVSIPMSKMSAFCNRRGARRRSSFPRPYPFSNMRVS